MSAAEEAELQHVIAALGRGDADPATLRAAHRLLSRQAAQRDAAARDLREDEERVRLAVDAAGVGVFDWDVPTDRVTWNAQHARICGIEPTAFGGTYAAFAAVVHPADRDEVGLRVAAAMAGRQEYDHEHRVLWPSGQVRWVRARGRFRYDDRGEPVRMTGVISDVTPRRAAEAARVAEARAAAGDLYLRTVMDRAPLGACVVDGGTLVCKWVTEGFVRTTAAEVGVADLVGRPCREFIPDFDGSGLRALFERVAATGEPFAHDEYPFHGFVAGRGVTYWRWALTPLPPPADGAAPDLMIQAMDVTAYVQARKRAEADAERAEASARRAAASAERAAAGERALADLQRSTADALALLDTLLAHAPVGIALVGPDYRIRLVNRAIVDITGTTSENQVGRTVAEVLPDLWPKLAPLYARVLRGETILDVESAGQSPARPGDVRHWQASLYPVRTGGGGGAGGEVAIGVIVADVTDRRRAADAAKQAEDLLRALCDNTPDPVFVKDLAGRQLLANPACARLVGKPHHQIVGRTTEEVFDDPAIARAMRENDRRVVELGRVEVVEETVQTPDGPRVFMVSKAPYRDAAGRVVGLVGVGRDITARKRMEQDLRVARDAAESANRAKDLFLSTLSHELRTPLNAVLGWAQLLKLETPDPAAVAEAADGIEHAAQSLARLVEDLLDVGRVVAGKLRVESAPVDLASVVDRAAAAVRFAALEKDVTLDVTRPGEREESDDLEFPAEPEVPGDGDPAGLTVVSGDARRLEQVVVNLLGNAVKFTPAGGRVTVRVGRAAGRATVVVRDTGQGIAADFLPHVFDRFAQADDLTPAGGPPQSGSSAQPGGTPSTAARPGRRQGLGLGLSIVKHLVELHGGTVTAASNGPGAGATFTVHLPLAATTSPRPAEPPAVRDPEAGRAAPVGTAPPFPSLAGVRAVVVDDVAASRAAVAELLRRCGADVTECGSADDAVAAVRGGRADVLVSDVAMPGADGYELVRRVRALPPGEGGAVPAVALTGRAAGEDWLAAVGGEFDAHLAKPADAADVVRVVAALAARSRDAQWHQRVPNG
jgi:PAS domain S-box-containing protein